MVTLKLNQQQYILTYEDENIKGNGNLTYTPNSLYILITISENGAEKGTITYNSYGVNNENMSFNGNIRELNKYMYIIDEIITEHNKLSNEVE
ncbi:MAG: hypothetical protein HFJ94_03830 [Muribaculaceae bacterium]|nr:hypothetical protein [Muribaculaceae bacterium]